MLINAVTPCYNDETTIGAVIKCLKPFVKNHFVMLSEVPYFGEGAKPDRSEEIAEDLGAIVVKGKWALDHYQRNAGQTLSCGADWVFTFDSDELMCAEELENLIKFAEKTPFHAITNCPEVYWFDTDHVLCPKSTYSPPIMCRPNVRYPYIRNINCPFDVFEGTMHHLSWCRPKDILKKVLNYAHATDFKDADKWYENVFCKWTEGQNALMPDNTSFPVIYQPLPKELKDLLTLSN